MDYTKAPTIVGGNGHSGTRLFAEILLSSGVYMGVPGISYARKSKDLNVRGLMNKWIKPYLLGLNEAETKAMRRQFQRRLRLLVPFRSNPWGFKNPRSMFLLPLYCELFPELKFIHVIRDGRDMCFGNPFIHSPTYWGIVPEEQAKQLSTEERMIVFWGEANRRVKSYCETVLQERYLRIRFEDICDNPEPEVSKIIKFIDGPMDKIDEMARLVRRPRSIGRWREYDSGDVQKVVTLGAKYLEEFGYN